MMSHRNVTTNVYQRDMLISRVRQQGWTHRRAGAVEYVPAYARMHGQGADT